MSRVLTWSDLDLTAVEKAALEPFALNEPEAVVSLAKGSPELLSRVLPGPTVERLKKVAFEKISIPVKAYPLGVPLDRNVPMPKIVSTKSFETRRANLIKKFDAAKSPAEKAKLSMQLQRLYSGKSSQTQNRAGKGLSYRGR